MHDHSEALIRDLSARAQAFRIQVLKMVHSVQSGHIGGAFSCAEILAALYFHHLRIDPADPDWPARDRLLFSKGHACAMLYTCLAHRGFFPVEELMTFRRLDSRLQGHPDRLKLPGIEICAGPLGHGVAVGVGMALALKTGATGSSLPKPSALTAPSARASAARVYVVLGDGEINAGVVWEGVMTAAKYRLGNLTAILDYNGIQQTGATADVMPTEPIAAKWEAFNWHVQEIDGHNAGEILDALDRADEVHARPSVIVARTTKGKGVSFMEYDHRWHGMAPIRHVGRARHQRCETGGCDETVIPRFLTSFGMTGNVVIPSAARNLSERSEENVVPRFLTSFGMTRNTVIPSAARNLSKRSEESMLALIHTVTPLIDVFTRLCGELLPGVPLKHILDEPLLERVRQRGHLAPEDAARLQTHVAMAEQIGASAVLVTCSTISPCVDDVRPLARIPVLKIDEAMVAEAVSTGTRIGVVATNATTLEPTRRLLEAQAHRSGKQIETELVLVEGALSALLSGDGATHDALIKQATLDLAQRADVVVLAQASMARVLDVLPQAERRVPILSSPHLALRQVKRLLGR